MDGRTHTHSTFGSTGKHAMRPLTLRQEMVLAYLAIQIRKGKAPTLREVAAHFQCSVNTITGHMRALERRGYICREPYTPRGVRIIERPEASCVGA